MRIRTSGSGGWSKSSAEGVGMSESRSKNRVQRRPRRGGEDGRWAQCGGGCAKFLWLGGRLEAYMDITCSRNSERNEAYRGSDGPICLSQGYTTYSSHFKPACHPAVHKNPEHSRFFLGAFFPPYYLQNFLNLSESNIHKNPSPCSRSKAFFSFLFLLLPLTLLYQHFIPQRRFPHILCISNSVKVLPVAFPSAGGGGAREGGNICVYNMQYVCVWLKSGNFFLILNICTYHKLNLYIFCTYIAIYLYTSRLSFT